MAEKTRVLFISHSPYWYGAERCLYHLVKEIDRQKYEPIVAIPGRELLNEKIEQLGIPVVEVNLQRWVLFKEPEALTVWGFRKGLRERVNALVDLIKRESIGLVYTNTCVIIGGALAARQCGVPHVWHIHELLGVNPELFPFVDLGSFFSLMKDLAAKIVVVSKSVKAQIEKYVQTDAIEVVYNGVECADGPSPEPNGAVSRFRPDPRSPVVIFAGALCHNKGVMTLVDAAPLVLAKHPKAQFLLVGRDMDIKNELEARLKARGVERSFHLPGFCPNVLQLIAQSDLLVLPSLADSLPVVVLEAMSVGKPVVATRSGGAEEMVVDGETGHLVPTRDPAALAQSIVTLLDDPAQARAMGQRGRERVRALYSQRQYARNFERVFDAALRSSIPDAGKEAVRGFLETLETHLKNRLNADDTWEILDRQQIWIKDLQGWTAALQKLVEEQQQRLAETAALQKLVEKQQQRLAELEAPIENIRRNLIYRACQWVKRLGYGH